MIRNLSLCIALLALVSLSAQAQLFIDRFDDVGGSTEWWAVGFDEGNHYIDNGGPMEIAGGSLNMPTDSFAWAVTKDFFAQDIEIVADITLGAINTNGYFTLGMIGSTAHKSVVDCDLYESGGNYFIGIYNAGAYVNSTMVTPAPIVGSSYIMAATRVGDVFSIELLEAGTSVASVSATLPGLFTGGNLYIKNDSLGVSINDLTVVDLASDTVDFHDDFAAMDPAKWAFEPNPEDVGGGMRIYNFRSDGVVDDLPRFDSSNPGFLTMGPMYCRMPTRYWTAQGYDWFGNVDVVVKLRINQDSYFSVATDNRTNEGARYGVVLDTANNQLVVANVGGAAGFPNSPPALTPIASQSLAGLYDYTVNPDVYLYLQRNGNLMTAWIGLGPDGDEIAGTRITDADITGANPSGQIVITNHHSVGSPILIDLVGVFDYGDGWNLSVNEWNQY